MSRAGWAHTRLDPFYRRFEIHWAGPRWPVLRELIRLGIPMGLSYALEATSFTFITLLVARLGTSVMGGHQVVANLAALCFMVPLSLASPPPPSPPPRSARKMARGRGGPRPPGSGSR